jgi:hypothetical protein
VLPLGAMAQAPVAALPTSATPVWAEAGGRLWVSQRASDRASPSGAARFVGTCGATDKDDVD